MAFKRSVFIFNISKSRKVTEERYLVLHKLRQLILTSLGRANLIQHQLKQVQVL